MRLPFEAIDWIALAAWAACWLGYQLWAERTPHATSLGSAVRPYRHAWMREAMARENRVSDAALVGNLMQSATFLASTTLLVLGGLLALLGTLEKSAAVVQSLPFALKTSSALFELKALTLALVLAYAFLRFIWAIRLFNLVVILLGAYPPARPDAAERAAAERATADERLADRAARLNELAGASFTQGLRAYYYAVPLLLWLVNPWLFVAGSLAITLVTWWLEFRSATVEALTQP